MFRRTVRTLQSRIVPVSGRCLRHTYIYMLSLTKARRLSVFSDGALKDSASCGWMRHHGARGRIVAGRCPGTWVVGADTVVAIDGMILGKPKDEAEAKAMLRRLAGATHSVFTGVALIAPDGRSLSETDETKVTFRPLSDEEISAYVACGESMDKAGAYGIQGYFARYVRKINGDYNNVVGLPVARLLHEIKKM